LQKPPAARSGRPEAQPGVSATALAAAPAALSTAALADSGSSRSRPSTPTRLPLHSSVALVVDQQSGDVLLDKNPREVLPIASITKLMTAMVVLDARQRLDEPLQITRDDIDTLRHSGSRLRPGVRLTRGEMLQLALMSSENRAANALGRHYPGGMPAFVAAMNAKARTIGMHSSRFVEPTGLSSRNVSNGHDLARLVREAWNYPLIRQYSVARSLSVRAGQQSLGYYNTNRLVSTQGWTVGLQKTGYISDAGNCLVMQARIDGRPLIFVLLDANGAMARFGDAQRIRAWLQNPSSGRYTQAPLLAPS
jgi:D-alanyl-D-alanine endopeptidase (penicillin-binding protein 7)